MDVSQLQVSVGIDISDFQDAINTMITALDNVADSVQKMAGKFTDAGSDVGESAKSAGGDITEFGDKFLEISERAEKIGGAFEKTSTIIKLFNGALEAGEATTGGIITLISALAAIGVECYYKFDTFRAVVNAVWAVIKDLASIIGDALIAEFKMLYDITVWVAELFKDFGTIVLTFAVAPIKLVIDAIQALYYAVVDVDWSKALGAVKTFGVDAVNAADAIKDSAVDMVSSTKTMAQNVAADFTESANKISETTSRITSDVSDAYNKAFEETQKVNDVKAKTDKLTLSPGKIEVESNTSLNDVDLSGTKPGTDVLTPLATPSIPAPKADDMPNMAMTVVPGIQASAKAVAEYNEKMKESAELQKEVQDSAVSAFSSIGQALGQMIAGQKAINPLAALMKQMGDSLKKYGEFLITAGTAMLFGGDPYGAAKVGEGIALEAVGTAMGAVKMAQGGIVSGSTFANIGEYAGASHNPEVVAPLDKLRNMMGGSNGNTHYSFEIMGDKMVTAIQRQSNNNNFVLGTNNQ